MLVGQPEQVEVAHRTEATAGARPVPNRALGSLPVMTLRISVLGTGYLGATHAACMAELGFEVLGIDVDADEDRSCSATAGRRSTSPASSRCCARASTAAGCGSPRRTRDGADRRRPLPLRRHPAAQGRVRRRPALRRRGRRRPGPAPGRRDAWSSASPPCRSAPPPGCRPASPSSPRPARPSSSPGTRSSSARASRSRTPCAPTGWSSAVRPSAPRPLLREVYASRDRRRHARSWSPTSPPPSWSRSPPTPSSPPRSRSSTRWPRSARRPAPTSRSWPTRSATTRGSAASSSTPASASAAAACPRTSARSWPGPASWASTRR